MIYNIIDLKNQRFERLIAIKMAEKRDNRAAVWLCRCDCGDLKYIRSSSLRSGHTQSCGCLSKEKASERMR